MKNRKALSVVLVLAIAFVLGIAVAYAVLSTTLRATFNSVTQTPISWNVRIASGNFYSTDEGVDSTGRFCGNVNVSDNYVSIDSTTLSKPGDACKYSIVIGNFGDITAELSSINVFKPDNVSCTVNGSTMVCGNITYMMTTDAAGNFPLTVGTRLNERGGTANTFLTVKYTGESVSAVSTTQTGAGFSLGYKQA